jgi:hypothetical protein
MNSPVLPFFDEFLLFSQVSCTGFYLLSLLSAVFISSSSRERFLLYNRRRLKEGGGA